MFQFKKPKKELTLEEKLDFSTEVTFMMILFGAVFSQLLVEIFIAPFTGYFDLIFTVIGKSFGGCLAGAFVAILFAPPFRVAIYLIEKLSFNETGKQLLTLITGVIFILLIYYLFMSSFHTEFGYNRWWMHLIRLGPYLVTFILYTMLKQIWNTENYQQISETMILDDMDWN